MESIENVIDKVNRKGTDWFELVCAWFVRVCVCECVSAGVLQHEVLLPAGLVPTHRDGGALDILDLQRHVAVELFCVRE